MSKRRFKRWCKSPWLLAGLALFLLGGAAAWKLLRVPELAQIGVGYTAQQTCACLFVSRRPAESCRQDLEPMARWFISAEIGAGEVTAHTFGLARARSRYQQGFGCSLTE